MDPYIYPNTNILINKLNIQEIYAGAGESRTVNISKSERVLNGLSIAYSDKNRIASDLKTIFSWSNQVYYSY